MRFKRLFNYIILLVSQWCTHAKLCPGLSTSVGVKVTCESPEGLKVNCNETAVSGSKAIFTCLPYYKNERESYSVKCRDSGGWFPYRSFACHIDCGRQNQLIKPLIAYGYATSTAEWPWHVAIFRRVHKKKLEDPDKFEFICGGSIIISSWTILTAAHCLTISPSSTTVTPPDSFRIVLGSVSSDYEENTVSGSPAKIFSANKIICHPDYNPATYEADIGLIQLSSRVTFDSQVRPVCYPRRQGISLQLANRHLTNGSTGYVAGYGRDETGEISKSLNEIQLPIATPAECAESLGRVHAHSQFCAGYNNATAVCSGDSGGGFYFPFESGTDTRYIIQGLVSYGRQGKCRSYTVFTKIINFADWLEKEEAKFTTPIKETVTTTTTEVSSNVKYCGKLEVPLNGQIECYQNSSLETKIPCHEGQAGAVAKFSCITDYMEKILEIPSPHELSTQYFATCLPEGQWSTTKKNVQCEPECGLTTSGNPGDHLVRGDAVPWHVKIYGLRKVENSTKPKLTQLCSGSLIEKSFIITSADCVTGDRGSLLPIRHFKVVLGTNSSEYSTNFKSPHIQVLSVKKMWIPHTFLKNEKTGDIALIQLQNNANLTDYVKRVCYLRDYQADIVFGSWGKSANFLKTIENKQFDVMRHAITFSSAECATVEMRVPPRSFCSPVKRGDIVCKNDTGHGIVFTHQQNTQLHILKGVLSHVGSMSADPRTCLVASYVVYTQVEAFGAWILDIISSANNSSS